METCYLLVCICICPLQTEVEWASLKLWGVKGVVDTRLGHRSLTLDCNSTKQSSENITSTSLIGNSSLPTSRQGVALYGGSKLLKFNVFVAATALTKGAIHNMGVIEEDKPINSPRGRLTSAVNWRISCLAWSRMSLCLPTISCRFAMQK